MNNAAFIINGLLFASALWVGFACIKRLNLMHWRYNDACIIVSYIAIAMWAASYVLGIAELQHYGIGSVALLFWSGRKRWLTSAPPETRIDCAPPTANKTT